MKKGVLGIVFVFSVSVYAMQHEQRNFSISLLRPQLMALLEKNGPLTPYEIQCAAEIIKLVRAQSPVNGFKYEGQLEEKIGKDALNTDPCIVPPNTPKSHNASMLHS